MTAAKRLIHAAGVPAWQTDTGAPLASLKLSLANYRREVVRPAVMKAQQSMPVNPPLPWAWIASIAGTTFSEEAFALWWQFRALGQPFPIDTCPWCENMVELTTEHLRSSCILFGTACWTRGVRPEEVFNYPPNPDWLTLCLHAVSDLHTAIMARNQVVGSRAAAPNHTTTPWRSESALGG